MDYGALIRSLANFSSPELWLYIVFGIAIGLFFGIVPGISGMTAITLLLPFIFNMQPMTALTLIMVILATQYLGGGITAILLNVPGTSGNAATLLDGYPMSQRGEAGRAVGAAEAAGGLAHIVTAVVALLIIPLIVPMLRAIVSADMVFIVLTGIILIGSLSGGSLIKGLISGGLGLMIAFIGFQPTTGYARYTFGSLYLYDGLALIPVLLGLFSIPEMVALATRGGTISQKAGTIKGLADVWRGVMDVFRHWWLVVRSELIGFIVGIVPAAGPTPATFIAYAHAKQTSKQPLNFGKGNIEGVIAAESANNSSEAGDLLTTLALGIPGSPAMALVLAAITMLGLAPGPEMLTRHLDLSVTLMWTIGISAVIGAIFCILMAPTLAKVAFIPGRILVPIVLVLALSGAYAYHHDFNDTIVVVVFGAVGFFMRRFGFNRPAFLLGFVLGPIFEKFLFIAHKVSGPFFFNRPISWGLIVLIAFTLAYGPIKNAIKRRRQAVQA